MLVPYACLCAGLFYLFIFLVFFWFFFIFVLPMNWMTFEVDETRVVESTQSEREREKDKENLVKKKFNVRTILACCWVHTYVCAKRIDEQYRGCKTAPRFPLKIYLLCFTLFLCFHFFVLLFFFFYNGHNGERVSNIYMNDCSSGMNFLTLRY